MSTPSLAFAQNATAELPSYGWLLAKTVFVLIGVCLLAFGGLKWLSNVSQKRQHGAMEIVARLPIEPRRSVIVIRVGDRGLIVGNSESGMSSLGEMTSDELDQFRELPKDDAKKKFTLVEDDAIEDAQ